MYSLIPNLLTYTHFIVASVLKPGDVAVDATAGNGYDTVKLAELVGATGKVYAFDIQTQALQATKELLLQQGHKAQVELLQLGHERMLEVVKESVRVVMFNLGYLPKGDHSIITKPETTLQALEAATQILAPNGLISVMLYGGHSGGELEVQTVLDWAESLKQRDFNVMKCQMVNRPSSAPFLLILEKSSKNCID